jgi:hypothetical protein
VTQTKVHSVSFYIFLTLTILKTISKLFISTRDTVHTRPLLNECLMNKSRNFCFFTKDFDLYCALNKMQLLISFFNHKRFAKCSCQTGHDIIIIITFMYLALILDIMTSVMEYQFRKFGWYIFEMEEC